MAEAVTLVILLLYTGLVALGQPNCRLAGLVRDSGGRPIDGASISLTPDQAGGVTGEQGGFLLNNIPSGNYTLSVSDIGYNSCFSTVGFSLIEDKEFVVTLEKDCVALNGLTVTAQKRSEKSKDTLFGPSAQIGAIHLITRHARNETSGNLTLGTGNYNQMRANGYLISH